MSFQAAVVYECPIMYPWRYKQLAGYNQLGRCNQ